MSAWKNPRGKNYPERANRAGAEKSKSLQHKDATDNIGKG
jgi:hypothetical protein